MKSLPSAVISVKDGGKDVHGAAGSVPNPGNGTVKAGGTAASYLDRLKALTNAKAISSTVPIMVTAVERVPEKELPEVRVPSPVLQRKENTISSESGSAASLTQLKVHRPPCSC